ncbi:uncharacterized protein F5891DRAFT_986314 [Suillus fuscotomentosus]|uniref:Uncharacterized protein n=1 Tax=Suillus fuscotomentosus TaxID=1912939 RepID=A0AAD4HEW0_9AGAM|nr:uncharacterized protein F5891DRAFT_986314 [Suillus fuscotomentosus]KAG1892934.1 hypothetical protein F5891DRAFT_986314 [Suillus fuscotomentosus]
MAIDANFRLKRRDISSDEADPSLSKGWSYFVEEEKFKSHLKEHCPRHRRYINMDYLFFSTLRNNCLDVLNVLYDIFHLPAHIKKCQTMFSFNFTHFVGHTDGEAPERGWSNINLVASSTKAMGPGCCRDTLDDHFGDWNWKKVVGLAWTVEMEKWEENPNDTSVTNTLESKSIQIMQAAAHLKLVEMEAEELAHGIDLSLHPDISPSVLIVLGLDLEEEDKIQMWRSAQVLYIPAVQILTTTVVSDPHQPFENAVDIHLWLPSSLKGKPLACTKRYRVAWEALKTLAPLLKKVGWRGWLQDLKDEDVKPLVDPFSRETKGRRRLTWIWMMTGVDTGSDGGDVDGVRVEWCKSRARAMHWAEEMRRVLQFFDWQANWWDEQKDQLICETAAQSSVLRGQATTREAALMLCGTCATSPLLLKAFLWKAVFALLIKIKLACEFATMLRYCTITACKDW